jgi:Ser/Thr protein kinase RdoA (MazF antagonist)
LLTYIDNTRCFDTVTSPAQAREVGRALGTFHALISDLPVSALADTLEGFHITPGYLAQFDAVLAAGNAPTEATTLEALRFVAERRDSVAVLEEAKAAGRLVERPIHGDPKVNNVLMDREGTQAVALIDLDTVKPGLVHYDIGDALRSGCNPLGEDTPDLTAVCLE